MSQELEFFKRNGYVVIPSVLSRSEVNEYRSLFETIFTTNINPLKGDGLMVRNDVLIRFEQIRSIFFREAVISAVRKILGDKILVLPETSIMESQYGGWHKDTTSIDLFGYDLHKQSDFNLVNAAIYLQDNDEWGGGLDVVPGSHLESDPYVETLKPIQDKLTLKMGFKRRFALYMNSVWIKLMPAFLKNSDNIRKNNLFAVKKDSDDIQKGKLSIRGKAGDMVVFDLRLNHKATWPHEALTEGNHITKYGFFAILAGRGEAAAKYSDYLNARAEKQYAYNYLRGRKLDPALRAMAEQFNVEMV